MSEILTREQVVEALRGSWHVMNARILTPATHRQMIDSHLALHDAHDAALERVRALGAALDVVTRHWIGRTDAHGIGFDEDGFEQQLMALDRAFAALAAVATPQGQEVNDANG